MDCVLKRLCVIPRHLISWVLAVGISPPITRSFLCFVPSWIGRLECEFFFLMPTVAITDTLARVGAVYPLRFFSLFHGIRTFSFLRTVGFVSSLACGHSRFRVKPLLTFFISR